MNIAINKHARWCFIKHISFIFATFQMTVPKSKILSVSKGLLALADVKTGCPQSHTSQTVTVNITPTQQSDKSQQLKLEQQDTTKARSLSTPKPIHPIIDGVEDPDITIVPSANDVKVTYDDSKTEEENPYAECQCDTKARDLATVEDAAQDINQLQALLKSKEDMALALTLMLNLVENNPLIVNKYIVAPEDILCELIKLLTSASKVTIQYLLDADVGCSCGSLKYLPVDKIYVEKDNETYVLKYSFPDAIKLLDDHRISTKLVVNNA